MVNEKTLAQGLSRKLENLRRGMGLTIDELAHDLKECGMKISVDSLKNYENQATGMRMSAITLRGLASYYGVSSDYLLGLTETPSADMSVRAICDVTGLSQKAAESVTDYNYYYKVGDEKVSLPFDQGLKPSEVLNRLLESTEFWQVIGNLASWTNPQMQEFFRLADEWNPLKDGLPASQGYLEPNPAFVPLVTPTQDCYLAEAVRHFGQIAEKILKSAE